VLDAALEAHRAAQGGGSGIDVLAAALGGTLLVRRAPVQPPPVQPAPHGAATAALGGRTLQSQRLPLPPNLVLEVWVMGKPASTAELVRQVFSLEERDPARFEKLFEAQVKASVRAAAAVELGDAQGFISALAAQHAALSALGDAAAAPIVTDAVRSLHERAMPRASLLPSGAGGGDVSLYAGLTPSDDDFRAHAAHLGLFLLDVRLGAQGVHAF
jgi:phosphomevalonate kinase